MFCGKCGADNPNDNQFCYSCGAPLLGAPKKEKSSKALVITIVSLLVLILAVAAVLVFVVIKPFKSKETPKDVVTKYLTSLQKGDAKAMKACFLPEFYEYQEPVISELHENMTDTVKEEDATIEYTFYDYEKLTGSELKEFKENASIYLDIDSNKIQEYGKLDTKVKDSVSNESFTFEFTVIKYDGKWYLAMDPMLSVGARPTGETTGVPIQTYAPEDD